MAEIILLEIVVFAVMISDDYKSVCGVLIVEMQLLFMLLIQFIGRIGDRKSGH